MNNQLCIILKSFLNYSDTKPHNSYTRYSYIKESVFYLIGKERPSFSYTLYSYNKECVLIMEVCTHSIGGISMVYRSINNEAPDYLSTLFESIPT